MTVRVDVYPVGVLKELIHTWHILTAPKFPASVGPPSRLWRLSRARTSLGYVPKTVIRHIRQRDWRALKNTFNGYLAEPYEFPPGDYVRRCGTGWTKARAMRSLRRRLPKGSM